MPENDLGFQCVVLHLALDDQSMSLEFDDMDAAVEAAWTLFVDEGAHSLRITVDETEVMGEGDILWRATVLGFC